MKQKQDFFMEAFLQIFRGLDINLMVTDPETDEVLFASDKLNAVYGFSETPVGKRCWEVFHSTPGTGRCADCYIPDILQHPGTPLVWETQEPATGRYFRKTGNIVPWPDGRAVHMVQGLDVTDNRSAEAELSRRLEQQEIMSEIAQSFISTEDVPARINNALQLVGSFMELDRAMLICYDDKGEVFFPAGWYASDEYRFSPEFTLVASQGGQRSYYENTSANHIVCEDVVGNADFRKLAEVGVRAFLSVPIFVDDQMWGVVSLEMCTGTRHWTENNIQFARFIGNTINVVLQREKIRDGLMAADERIQTMLDASPFACVLFDRDAKPLDCNQEALRMFDFPSREVLLQDCFSHYPQQAPEGKNSMEKTRELLEVAFDTGRLQLEWQYLLPNGEEIPADLTLVRVWWRNNYCVAAYFRDLRQIRNARKRTREAEARTVTMLNLMPMAGVFFDAEYNVIDCNDEAARMYGMPSKRAYCENFYTLLSPPHQPNGQPSEAFAKEMLRRAFESGREVFEWEHRHTDGTPLPAEITLLRVNWRNGYRIAGYARDLREIKATMRAMEKTQDELRDARDRAEESARLKTSFLANMSHEIRTPMNAIIGMAELAKNSRDLERVQYCLSKVDDAASHLLGVINDILDMSKIEAGKVTMHYFDFPLESVLQRVSSITNFWADDKRQNFMIRIAPDVPVAIVSDPQRLTQIVTNLLSNATKFTLEEGSISLRVHLAEDRGDEALLLFEVTDTGIGISPEEQEKLFLSFEQADGSISRRFGGTGLGLAISKSLVEQMGGEIMAESREGEGSRFCFTLPVKKGRSGGLSLLHPDVKAKNIRLLFVSDMPEVRGYFHDIAASLEIPCSTAKSAEEAIRLIREEGPFDIVFIDWMMPGINGIELTHHIHELQKNRNVSVVVMTSTVEWAHIERMAKEAGAMYFIARPILSSSVISCINECFGLKNPGEGMAETLYHSGDFSGKRILLVEDLPINQEIIIAMLEGTGVEIDCADNGIEACRIFAQNPDKYNLILMDVHMPELDGYAATRQIRAMDISRAKRIPIIAMTANVFREDIERSLASGMNDHIGKPIDLEDMILKLKRYL